MSPGTAENFAERLARLDRPKGAPAPGDWMAEQNEKEMTFERYVASNPNRPNERRSTLYLVPIGDFTLAQETAVAKTAQFLGLVYGVPVRWLKRVSHEAIPPEARRSNPHGRQLQFLSSHLLDQVLKPRRPDDAVAVLGLTATDLWPGEGWNFVFGQASLRDRVGVWSLARYGNPASRRGLLRTLKVAMHETGHMFGLPHCVRSECGMNGSNSLAEADSQPLPFCAECERKLWWACALDPVRRNAALLAFAERNGLGEAAGHWREAAIQLNRP